MPLLRKKLPKTLLKTTRAAQLQVFHRNRADSDVIPSLVAGHGGRRGLPRALALRYILLAFRAQRHVLAGFFVQPPAVVAVEHRLPHDPPRYARPEEVFAVEALH